MACAGGAVSGDFVGVDVELRRVGLGWGGDIVTDFVQLVEQVEAMVEEAGSPVGFDARAWLARWLTVPVPALRGARPIDLMGTMEGQRLVSQT